MDAVAAQMHGEWDEIRFNDDEDSRGMKIIGLPDVDSTPSTGRLMTSSVESAAAAGKDAIGGASAAVSPELAASSGFVAFPSQRAA